MFLVSPGVVGKSTQCPICNKSFFDIYTLRRHQERHREVRELHTCQLCGKGFTRAYGLNKHIKMNHDFSAFDL
ncbi:hypothetical protein LAZ67_1001193 [Cordylochernes scorpioides]|uniref:C2H2-type domain-containing protein n=1 Tax=Cordylochernes scorpioides TaxID=51811 RepID=A0ABY6JW18_9ARAC|nr:hypothetical protein LAZ67_1001193 [Cordylochernes scorpioides]